MGFNALACDMAFLGGFSLPFFGLFFGMSCLFKVFFSTLITSLLGLTLDDMIRRMSLPKFFFENSAKSVYERGIIFFCLKTKQSEERLRHKKIVTGKPPSLVEY